MRGNPRCVAVSVSVLLLGLAAPAAAHLHTSQGRFIQRDPLGYVDGMNVYLHVRSRPTFFRDSTGNRCDIALNCGDTASGTQHCGIHVWDDDGVWGVHGSGGDLNQLTWELNPGAWGIVGPWNSYSDDVCECLFTETQRWNGLAVPRNHLCRNSNWTMKCLTSKCGVNFSSFPTGDGAPPIGWNCRRCKRWTVGPSGTCVCVEYEFEPCP